MTIVRKKGERMNNLINVCYGPCLSQFGLIGICGPLDSGHFHIDV